MSGQEPTRSQSTTSLSRFYNSSAANGGRPAGAEDTNDPRLDFCNSFWGVDNRGYDVVMARLRGAGRTIDELKAFWKERAAIEEDYSKRLTKLSKTTLGKDEIGDLAISLQHVLEETLQQAQYHHSLSNELKTNVEQPTARLAERMTALRRGIQAQVERSWRNKGLQEGHVSKAREKYEQDCLKLNSYHANQALTQGKEAEKLQSKVERVRQTIGQNEQDFRQFVRVLEGTQAKWEQEWKVFCDAVQDEEEERLAATKDIIWSYANAVSQVCVEDDSSCERVREKLEQFEPQNDMVAFVRGWGTGDQIPDPPQFVNYSAGEYPKGRTSHIASFTRETNRPLPPPVENYLESEGVQGRDGASSSMGNRNGPNGNVNGNGSGDDLVSGMQSVNLQGDQIASSPIPAPPPADEKPRAPFGGIAMPGLTDPRAPSPGPQSLASPALANDSLPKRLSSMGPPPAPPTMSMPEPRIPSRQGPPSPAPRSAQLDEDPMAKALADLRRDAPPASSVRRNASHIRRPDSTSGYSNRGMNNTSPAPASSTGHGAAGAPGSGRMSYQQPPSQPSAAELTLSPPAPGHTAAALAKSMDDFNRRTDKRGSVSYNTYGDDVVGAHPSSRPASPSPSNAPRAPSPAMMQPPSQPATHIADEVLSQYHQAFPGERNDRARSRAGSVTSHRSGNSFVPPSATQGQGQGPGEDPAARQAFAGIGAGGRSPSPAPQQPSFASPSISPVVSHGNLGPQNLGIRLDASGSITQDSMAEAYRRQYQAQQQQTQGGVAGGLGDGQGQQRGSFYAGQGQGQGHGQMPGQQPPKSPMAMSGPPPIGQRPTSAYGGPTQPHQQQPQGGPGPQQYTSPTSYAPPNTFATSPSMQQQQPPQQQQFGQQHRSQHSYSSQSQGYSNTAAPPAGYMGHQGPPQAQQQQQQQQQPQGYGGWAQQQHQPQQPQKQQNGYANRSASPAPPMQQHAQQQNPYQRSVSAAPGRGPSPAPMAQNQSLYRGASPAPGQQQQQQQYRAPSPAAQPQMGGYYPGSAQGHGQGQGQQTYSGYQGQPAQQQQSQQQQQRMARTPSPQPGVAPANAAPTGQWSTTGLPVLFYVKALYDYQSTSAAEFDFQAGDIIAVTSTPDDGWWSGELLDEARRIPGRTDFPSNL